MCTVKNSVIVMQLQRPGWGSNFRLMDGVYKQWNNIGKFPLTCKDLLPLIAQSHKSEHISEVSENETHRWRHESNQPCCLQWWRVMWRICGQVPIWYNSLWSWHDIRPGICSILNVFAKWSMGVRRGFQNAVLNSTKISRKEGWEHHSTGRLMSLKNSDVTHTQTH